MAGKRSRAIPRWFQVPPGERQYYREVFGFDPASTLIPEPKTGLYRYEEWFPLVQDIGLQSAGIEIGARVEIKGMGRVHNRIVFRQGKNEATVDCTHTVIFSGPVADIPTFATDDGIVRGRLSKRERQHLSKAGGPAQLPPWGHFAALKSYVAGIAETGIANMLRATAYPHGRVKNISHGMLGYIPEIVDPVPFGFNSEMQGQILRALQSIAPDSALALVADWCIYLIETAPPEWLEARRNGPLNYIFSKELLEYLWKNSSPEWLLVHLDNFNIIFSYNLGNLLRQMGSAEWAKTDIRIIQALSQRFNSSAPDAIVSDPFSPRAIVEELTHGDDIALRLTAIEALEVRPEDDAKKAKNGWLVFNGVYIHPQDQTALVALERVLGSKIFCRNGGRWPPIIVGSEEKVLLDGGFWITSGWVTQLELRNCRLKELPQEMRFFSALQKLDISGNKYEILPEVIGDLPSLVELNLKDNKLKELPECVGRLQNLSILDCSHNILVSLNPAISNLKMLETLDLSYNDLVVLPNFIEFLVSLRKLDVNHNHIQDISPFNRDWTSLVELNLSFNDITFVPISIKCMKNLKRLDLSSNHIKDLPNWLFGLLSLKELDLSGCYPKEIPEAIGNLLSLELLDLSSNKLEQIPTTLIKLRELRTLTLGRNRLSKFPAFLGVLPKLEDLELKNNVLQFLPEVLVGFSKLGWLDLSNNNLQSISDAMGRLPNLTRINLLGNNQLTNIPRSLLENPSVQQIDVEKPFARHLLCNECPIRKNLLNYKWNKAMSISHRRWIDL